MEFTTAYLESQGWGWMLALSEDDRDKAFYEVERDLRDEKERLETENSYEDDGPRWRRNRNRLREIAELLEPTGEVELSAADAEGYDESCTGSQPVLGICTAEDGCPALSSTSFAGQARAGGHGETDAPSMCEPPNSSTAEGNGAPGDPATGRFIGPSAETPEAVLENHHADTFGGMAA
jgi:hypothetical protein